MKNIPLEKFKGDDITYSYIASRADEDCVGYISTKSNIKPEFLFITNGLVKYEQGPEDGPRFYWNQDESLSDLLKRDVMEEFFFYNKLIALIAAGCCLPGLFLRCGHLL